MSRLAAIEADQFLRARKRALQRVRAEIADEKVTRPAKPGLGITLGWGFTKK